MSALATGREAWQIQHDVLFGGVLWGEGALVAVNGPSTGWQARYAPVQDAQRVWDLSEGIYGGKDSYIRMTPVPEAVAKRGKGRGSAGDSLGYTCFWADVDLDFGMHRPRLPLPSLEQAMAVLSGFAQPTLIDLSGGGLHLFWRLAEPVALYDDGVRVLTPGKAFMDRFADALATKFAEAGYGYDEGVPRDPARILRIVGTLNGKRPEAPTKVEILEHNPEAVYALHDLMAHCPERTKQRAQRETNRAVMSATRKVGGPLARKVNAAVPLDMVLEVVWGMEAVADSGARAMWLYPDPETGTSLVGSESSATVFTDADGGQSVTAFSTRLQAAWMQSDEHHALRSWDLAVIAFGGDLTIAKAVAMANLHKPAALAEAMREFIDHNNS